MDERTNKLLEQYKTSGPLTTGQIGDTFATTPVNQPITSASLSSTQTPIKLPEPVAQTGASRITGGTQAILQQDELEQKAAKEVADREAKLNENVSSKQSLLQRIGLVKQEETTKGQQEFGTDVLKEQRGKSVKGLRESQIREDAEIQALESQNLTDTGRASAEQAIRRKYGLEQNSLQLSYNLANTDLVAAEQTINDRISLLTEPLYAQLDTTKDVYNQISSSLSKAEDRVWQIAINNRENAVAEKNKIGEFAKTVAANGADASTISRVTNAKTMAEAVQAAGQFAGDVLERQKKQLEIQKLNKEIAGLSGGVNVDVSKLSPRGQQLMANVKNLRFSNVEESKRIISNIATRLANGDEQGAVDDLKDFAYQKMSMGQKTDYDNYEGAISSFESAANQINAQNISAGPYKALAEKAKPYASIKNDKAYADLRGVIELGQAQLRKGFYGTAVTGTEAANARNFLIQDSDPINVIAWKLENGSNFLQFTNDATVARQVGLDKPNLDDYLTYRVREKATGQIGSVPRSEYDPDVYEIVNQ